MKALAISRRRKRLSRRIALLGEQPRRKALAFRDSLDLQRDRVNRLIELRELRADLAWNLRRTCPSPVHASRESAGERKPDDDKAIVRKKAMEMSTACGGITFLALKPGGRSMTVVWPFDP